MTQPQQTIGNTVYRVGQGLNNYTEAGPLLDYMYKNYPDFAFYRAIGWINPVSLQFMRPSFPITITALPNPDPVAEEWREVALPDFRENQERIYSEFDALQIAMQEVCKADEVKLEWPECLNMDPPVKQFHYREADGWKYDFTQKIMTCFLLGGRVFVKGGV